MCNISDVSCRISRSGSGSPGDIAAQSIGCCIYAMLVHAPAARLDNPTCYGRDEKVTDNTDNKENTINRIAAVGNEIGVTQLFDILRKH